MIIDIRKLNKSYGNIRVFKDFNLQVEKGDFLLVYGESGAGKSTLLNIIGMLDEDYEGDITLLDKKNPKIHKEGQKILRTDLSYLFQNYGLVDNETVFYNLNIVDKVKKMDNKKEEMRKRLKLLGLEHINLKQRIYELSGGEQQRIAVAKIILKKPKVILCDEPTGSLDEENGMKVMEILKYLNEKHGITIIIVSHDKFIEKYVNKKIKI